MEQQFALLGSSKFLNSGMNRIKTITNFHEIHIKRNHHFNGVNLLYNAD
jgi:hypothetical protein